MSESASSSLKYVMSTIKSSFLPAMIFACGLVLYFAQNPLNCETASVLHISFYTSAGNGLALLALVNRSKPFFSLLTGALMAYFSSKLSPKEN